MADSFGRNSTLLRSKLSSSLPPLILAFMASSISNAVDSIVAGRFIGASALTAVGLIGAVIEQLHYAIILLMGIGASTVITVYMAEDSRARANAVFNTGVRVTVLGGVLLAVLEMLFSRAIVSLFTQDALLIGQSLAYFRPAIVFLPFELLCGYLSYCMYLDGKPRFIFTVSALTCLINLILDIVFVCLLDLGLMGLKLATICSCAFQLFLVTAHFVTGRGCVELSPARDFTLREDAHNQLRILRAGLPLALSALTTTVINAFFSRSVLSLSGVEGMTAFSVFSKFENLIYLAVFGNLHGIAIIVGILDSEKDNAGIRLLMRRTELMLVTVGLIVVVAAELFLGGILRLYGVGQLAANTRLIAFLRLSVLSYFCSGFLAAYRKYYSAIGQHRLVSAVTAAQPIVILPLLWLLTGFLGERGFWIAVTLNGFAAFVLWLGFLYYAMRKGGFPDLLLVRSAGQNELLDLSYGSDTREISSVTEYLHDFLVSAGLSARLIYRTESVVEEMSQYIASHNAEPIHFDLRFRVTEDELILSLRNDGIPLNPACDKAGYDEYEKLNPLIMISLIIRRLSYRRIFGINQLIIGIDTDDEENRFEHIPNQELRELLTPLDLTKVDTVVLHHMSHDGDVKDIEREHLAKGWSTIAYNFWIDSDGTAYIGRGFNVGAGVYGHNSHILSIGFRGDYNSHPRTMPDAQFDAGVDTIRYCMERVPTAKQIVGHKFFGNSDCPGQYFPLDEMISLQKRVDTLLIVSPAHPLPEGFAPRGLVDTDEAGISLVARVWDAFRELRAEANRRGVSLAISRGYEPESADSGECEHQSGLALDLAIKTAQGVEALREDSKEYEWLVKNAVKYGFVLRYPRGKESVTGAAFRPEHFRFVGREAAKAMTAGSLALEEYHTA